MFKLQFETGNAAFDPDYKSFEIKRILEKVAHDIMHTTKTEGLIHDVNGNKIGSWSVTD